MVTDVYKKNQLEKHNSLCEESPRFFDHILRLKKSSQNFDLSFLNEFFKFFSLQAREQKTNTSPKAENDVDV